MLRYRRGSRGFATSTRAGGYTAVPMWRHISDSDANMVFVAQIEDPVALEEIDAIAAVDGVDSVKVTTFQRRDTPDPKPLADGQLTFDRLEIAQLDNDPSRPERGVFRLEVDGGK